MITTTSASTASACTLGLRVLAELLDLFCGLDDDGAHDEAHPHRQEWEDALDELQRAVGWDEQQARSQDDIIERAEMLLGCQD